MNKQRKAIGISVIVAALLVYPAIKLYQYIAKRKAEGDNEPEETHHMKAFSPAYRGKHKPHHRSEHNGHPDHGVDHGAA